jgi:hypothetical protein
MFQYKPLDIKDFSGGMTDDYVNGPLNRGQYVTNFRILNNKTIKTRFGSQVDSDVDPQIPIGTQRVNTLINYNNDSVLFSHCAKKVYYRNPINYTAVASSVGTDLFQTASTQTHLAHTQWNGHLIITPESFDKPIKIYKDSTGVVRGRTAGLPELASNPALGTSLPAPLVVNPGDVDYTSNNINSPGNNFFLGLKVRATTTGVLPNPIAINTDYYIGGIFPPTFGLYLTLQNALDTTGNLDFIAAPAPSGVNTLVPQAGDSSYVYGFFYSYEYTIGDQTFLDEGPVTLVQKSDIYPVENSSITITGIPVLANALGDHYDTANIKIQIYRTIDGGQELYKVTELTNGTTSYVDTLSDTLLQDNQPIYTSGGVPDNDPPPLAKYCHSVNGVTYYAHIKEGTQIYPSLIRQSQALDPDSVPASFNDQLEDETTGLSSVQDIPIVGCRKHVYRIDGTFDEVGRGGMSHRRISDHAGLLSHESFVQAEGGLYWFGNDGIYYTEGFKCIKVTDHLNDRYEIFKNTLADKTRKIKGTYYENERSIYWTVSTTSKVSGLEECDAIWVLDLTSGVSSEMPCHLWNGEVFDPTSITVFGGNLVRGEKSGYVLEFKENYLTDPKIIPGQATSTWPENTIIWNFRSITSDFGSGFTRKTANKLLLDMLSSTTVSIQMTAINDEGRLQRKFTPIRWRKGFVWGDDDFVWGDPDFVWYYGGILSVDRRFPAKGLRFNYLQIDLTNAFTNIVNSDLLGTATVDATADTITTSSPTVLWPAKAVDYYIYLEQDNYTKGYKIIFRTDNVLTVDDSAVPTLIDGVQRWQIKGYKKGEVVNVVGFSVSWANTSRSFDTYNTSEAGSLV